MAKVTRNYWKIVQVENITRNYYMFDDDQICREREVLLENGRVIGEHFSLETLIKHCKRLKSDFPEIHYEIVNDKYEIEIGENLQ